MSWGTGGTRYGSFRWGHAAAVTHPGQRGIPEPPPDVISAAEAYGRGWRLADNADLEAGRARYPFDYVVGPDGDFLRVEGVRFLIQGIARRFVGEASSLLGRVLDVDAQAELERDIKRIATQDERVVAIPDATVYQVRGAPTTIGVELTIRAERALHDAVFAVEPPATTLSRATPTTPSP